MARAMKDSGIAWIGEIPEEWERVKVGFIYSFSSGDTLTSLDFDNDGQFDVYGANGLRGKYNKSNVHGKHILIGRVGAQCGNIHLVNGAIWVTEHALISERLSESVVEEYASFLLDAMNLGQYASGTAQPVIAAERIRKLYVPLPSIDEQKQIAYYLERKCARIDAVIEKTRASIEEYKKLKQAVITQAVTKGIRPNRPMKDSGIDWIGDIPLDWSILRKLLYAVNKSISYGIVKLFEPDNEHGVKVLRCSDVREGKIDITNIRTVSQDISKEYERTVLEGGEVLINVRGTLGGCAVVPPEMKGYNIAREVAMVSLTDEMLNRYLMYYFMSNAFISYQSQHLAGSVYIGLNIEMLSACPVTMPSLAEQRSITEYLDKKTMELDSLVEKKKKLLYELEALKKALIFEYVTGKKEVQ